MNDMKVNPGKFKQHSVFISIPAFMISQFKYIDLADGYKLRDSDGFDTRGEGFHNRLNEPHRLSVLNVQARAAYISGGDIPTLACQLVQEAITDLIAGIRCHSAEDDNTLHFKFLIKRSDDILSELANDFSARMVAERSHDPAKDWIQNSPNVEAFTMGTLVGVLDRPEIPLQRAETVFPDKKSLLIPTIYCALYEEEFQKMILDELKGDEFDMRLIESPIAVNKQDNTTGDSFASTATAYIAFVDFNKKELVRPDVGSTVNVRLILEPKTAANKVVVLPPAQETAQDNATTAEGGATTTSDDNASESGSDNELGNEDCVDVFNEDDLENESSDPNTWVGRIIDPMEITPAGNLTIMLERRRQPGFEGPRDQRPFVDTPLATINFRVAKTREALADMIASASAPTVRVKLSMHYSKQGFKDQVRCADKLWRSTNPQQQRIRQALLCHDSQNTPLRRVNILELKGDSNLYLTKTFNNIQKQTYDSFADTPEITLIHGPFGTGKTTVCINTAVEVQSNPDAKNRVLYFVESNRAVDDVALRWVETSKRAEQKKNILRAHTLKGEKSQVYRYFDKQGKAQERWAVSDSFVAEFAAFSFLEELSRAHCEVRSRSDPRRVHESLSISAAMHKKITAGESQFYRKLRAMLKAYGEDGFHGTPTDQRTEIKVALNTVLAEVISEADGIVATLAGGAKVNLATNYKPVLVILDEAARVTELKTMIMYALYSPRAFILAADHKQMRSTIQSASRWKDPIPYLNPFEKQGLLSGFERLILTGHEHSLLTIQHRCKGDIPIFPSWAFYNGQVVKAGYSPEEKLYLRDVREFVKQKIGAAVPTNRYAVDINKSRSFKEKGGTSSVNESEVDEMINDFELIYADPLFANKTYMIVSFYKAQVTRIKARLREFKNVKVMNGDELIAALESKAVDANTVDAIQGMEADVVLLSFVQTRNLSFLGEAHRLNVALTRGKWVLGLYLNFDLIKDIEKPNIENRHVVNLFKDLQKNNHVITRQAAYTLNPNLVCRNCNETGHPAKNCPLPKVPICRRCQEADDTENMRGHLAQNCTFHERLPRSLHDVQCRECRGFGHLRQNCPDVTCNRCKEQGHTSYICSQPAPRQVCHKCQQQGHVRANCKTIIGRAYTAAMRALQPGEFMPSPDQDSNQSTSSAIDWGDAAGEEPVREEMWDAGDSNQSTSNAINLGGAAAGEGTVREEMWDAGDVGHSSSQW
jgi:RecA/RadA recombinase